MTSPALHAQRRHPMRVVIRRTGLTADLLRAWERRYGVVAPERSEGGQRLYSDEEIERLSLLRRATAAGRNISQIAGLGLPQLEALVAEDESALARETVAPGSSAQAAWYFEAALQAIQRLDGAELEALLRRAAMQLSSETTIDEVLIPLLHELGESWHRGEISPAHEHLGTAAIRRVLSWISGSAIVSHYAPTALIATPAHQRHELGAKIAATTASTEGWRVTYLGCDLPADAIASAAVQSGAALVALSMIFPVDDPNLVPEVVKIRQLLPPQVPLVAGGAAAIAHQPELVRHGVRVVPDLQHLRVILRSLNPAAGSRSSVPVG